MALAVFGADGLTPAVDAGLVSATYPRYSAAAPTAAHAASASTTQPRSRRAAKRSCSSQRNIIAPAVQAAAPMTSNAPALKRVDLIPPPLTHACSASTA